MLTLILLLALPFVVAGFALSYSLDYNGPHHEVCHYSNHGPNCEDESAGTAEIDTVLFHQPATIDVVSQPGLWIGRVATWLSSAEILALILLLAALALRATGRRLRRSAAPH